MARTIKLEMVTQSHLSDILVEMSFNPKLAQTRIRFIKYLIDKFGGDLTKEVDIDEIWDKWRPKYNLLDHNETVVRESVSDNFLEGFWKYNDRSLFLLEEI